MRAWRWTGKAYEGCDSLPISDRGFRYGMSLFETIRIWHSRPLFFKQHLDRLHAACLHRRFTPDPSALLAAEQAITGGRDGVVRLYLTAGDGLLTESGSSQPGVFILAEERPAQLSDRCRLRIHPFPHTAPFGGLKTGNYWSNADAFQKAVESGYDEALLFDHDGALISAAAANVFTVSDGQIRTPSLSSGARDGVTRAWVMGQTRVSESAISATDLDRADEIFLTNSWYGILPATSLDGRSLPSREVGERLAHAFREAIGH
jgi:4-amino-4-deoxychorismate lyase